MPSVTCQQCSERLGDYEERRLAPGDQAAMESHFASCARCRELRDAYRALPDIVRRATDVSMPAEARARLRRRLAASKKMKKR
jgi:anti-sigma factor RsiW